MRQRCWPKSNRDSDETFPQVAGDIRYDKDRRTCVLPVKLRPGKTYVLWLNSDKFQNFNRPKIKVARTSASGEVYIDYKDTESLRKMISGNGKILSRKRTGASAMEQRMLAKAVKRARYLALLPYVTASG